MSGTIGTGGGTAGFAGNIVNDSATRIAPIFAVNSPTTASNLTTAIDGLVIVKTSGVTTALSPAPPAGFVVLAP